MVPQITMREIIILVLCFIFYIVAVEIYEERVVIARQGQLVQQEQSFNYEPPIPPSTDDGTTIIIDSEDNL